MAPTVPIEFCGQKQSMMGKSRKYSKGGQLSGFVPDYRHAVETMGESEGFGSSGRVDAEMTASEDSCAPSKMKCISLNGDDSFGVSMQVLQLSRLSRTERKDLERKLHSELEQVRDLQKRIAAMNSAVVISPSSDIRSCSDGKARPPVDAYPRPAVPAQVGKKRPPPGGRNGARNKKPGGVETIRPVVASNAQLMKQCEVLLNQLMKHGYAWVFQKPVDVVQLNIPDYFTVIKHPMDLGTVKSKLTSGGYSSPLAFAADVRLTFSNAMTYNPPENDVHIMAQTLSKDFEKRWKAIEKKLPVASGVQSLPVIHTEVIETPAPMPPSKKKKTTQDDTSFKPVKPAKPESLNRIMTDEERQKLTMEVDSLLDELPDNILDFLKEHSGEGQTSGEEIEIDFEVLSHDTLFALRKLLDDYLLEKEKMRAKAEPCEMEILHEPGFSNSSMQPCKGNDLVDEDVDVVGGNDAPMSSFPPVEIEKDAALKNSKCSSSSSSSSGSGSSSSGSDSASSSDSELRVPKASPAFGGGKDNFDSGANSGEKRNDIGDSEIANVPRNGVVPVEQKSLSKPAVEEGERHEEESAPPERQVSPEKLYRAAVLRNRFADTIFKAKEKALEKGDKLDPEKLRIEREELERRRKEEKARLQAEARAAEEARKKAEASAAAEARRLRELEREAARQALQMMEKTVDINENHFMEDLEMFRAVPDDHLSHFVEETSPEHSPNELGSFKLPGIINPLEKLGLFMKADDMEIEEEESEPTLADNVEELANNDEEGPANDYEEGPASDVKEGPANDHEEGPANGGVKEGPANDHEEGPANDVKEGSANEFEEGHEEGPAKVVKEDHEECPANDVVEGHEEGPSNNEGHEDGPANNFVQGSPEDVNGIATKVEEGITTEVEEGMVEGIANDLGEGLANDEEGIANDLGEGLANDEEGIANDLGEGLANDEEGIANDVVEGLANDDKGIANDVDVEEEPRNDDEGRIADDVGEGLGIPDDKGIANDVEERPRNDVHPRNDVGEGLANDGEDGVADDVGEGLANDGGEGMADDVEVLMNDGEEGMVDHVEEAQNDDEEEPQHDSGKEGLANDAEQGSADHVEERTAADVDVEDTEDIEID